MNSRDKIFAKLTVTSHPNHWVYVPAQRLLLIDVTKEIKIEIYINFKENYAHYLLTFLYNSSSVLLFIFISIHEQQPL
jgi:hypothetical protein